MPTATYERLQETMLRYNACALYRAIKTRQKGSVKNGYHCFDCAKNDDGQTSIRTDRNQRISYTQADKRQPDKIYLLWQKVPC